MRGATDKVTVVAGMLAMALFAGPCMARDAAAPVLDAEFVFEARVDVAKPLVIGESAHGLRRVVPIVGGTVSGPRFSGRVVEGGADWQFVRPDGVLEVHARYTLRADDGTLVMVDNRGMRHGTAAVMERLGRGEAVKPDEYYFRTSAQFEAPRGSKYEWLNKAVFVGVAERQADAAVVRFYQVK